MKDINKALGLAEDATTAQAAAAIDALNSQIASLSKASALPKGLTAADLAAKTAAGLTPAQALEVLVSQAENDAAIEKAASKKK